MKKLLCIVMTALLFISTTAYAEAPGQQAQVPAGGTVEESLYRMIPVFDSFARGMGIEGEVAYDANNPEFFWTQLHLLGSYWGYINTQATYENGNQIILPTSVMKEYAAASFNGTSALPDLPQSVTTVSFLA